MNKIIIAITAFVTLISITLAIALGIIGTVPNTNTPTNTSSQASPYDYRSPKVRQAELDFYNRHFSKAIPVLKESALQDSDPYSVYDIALIRYYFGKEPNHKQHIAPLFEALFTDLWIKGETNNDARADYDVSDIYLNGYGIIKKDSALSYLHLEKSAQHGDVQAQYILGMAYTEDDKNQPYPGDVHQDYTKALEWLTKSANQGHIFAMRKIASMYKKGQGVEANDKIASQWDEKANRLDALGKQ